MISIKTTFRALKPKKNKKNVYLVKKKLIY